MNVAARRVTHLIATALVAATISSPATALTFVKGEVLGPDGKLYQGASPANKEAIIANATRRDKPAGLVGRKLFVVVGDTVTFVSVDAVKNKSSDQALVIVTDAVIENVVGVEGISYKDLQAVGELTERTDIEVGDLVTNGDLATLAPETVAQIETFSKEQGISMENLLAINVAMENLPDERVSELVGELDNLLSDGFTAKVDDFITEVRNVPGGLEALAQYNSLDECLAGESASFCGELDSLLDEHDL